MRYTIVLYILLCNCIYSNAQLSTYRYWYDNDFAHATSVANGNQTISFTAANTSLSKGLHTLNFQSQDASGNWSSVITSSFSQSANGNILNAYRYWYDNNFNNAITVLSSDTVINFIPNTTSLSKGLHWLNFQSKDSSGNWSNVISESFSYTANGQNKIIYYRYWFDNNSTNAKIIACTADTSKQFVQLIDIESLNTGLHNLNYQYGDVAGNWSSVYTLSFSRGVITDKVFIEPKVYVQKSSVGIGDIQTITGKDFTSSGQINLLVQTSTGDLIATNSSFTYLPNGSFSYQLPITSSMPGGEYQVYATDVNTGATSPVIKFNVNNPVTYKLFITDPSSTGSYTVNTPVTINWSDFVTNTNAIGKTGFVQKKYKIEYSNNNGSTWNVIASSLAESLQSNSTDLFHSSYSFSSSGSYLVRVTDVDNPNDYNISNNFSVSDVSSATFSYNLQWDANGLYPKIINPQGLAADATSRILINLIKPGSVTKTVKSIHAVISDINNDAGTDILGKIQAAKITAPIYSEEANNANKISCDTTFSTASSNTNFYFWLVAPDDFTQTIDDSRSERTIQVTFTITYSDNSVAPALIANNIKVVRPPLLLVHGINGSAASFDNFQFDIGYGPINFSNALNAQAIWKYGLIPNLDNYASFDHNAQVLLGNGYVSFNNLLNSMRSNGYACNKVDYVCHSMGGCIARTIINNYTSQYYSSNNYHKGFINKLITINTPHNGSYIADYVIDNFNSINSYIVTQVLRSQLSGFFNPVNSNEPSDALINLQANDGGISFQQTNNIRNHLIGSSIDESNSVNINKIDLDLESNVVWGILQNADLPLKYFNFLTGEYNIPSYISDKYNNTEYFSNSDVIVPVSSQFANKTSDQIDIISQGFLTGSNSNSIIYSTVNSPFNLIHSLDATTVTHTGITSNITIGTKVMYLLNSGISSSSFSSSIPATSKSTGLLAKTLNANAINATVTYIDTNYIKIIAPQNNSKVYVDSTINVNVIIKDTSGLRKTELFFQGQIYQSLVKDEYQTYNIKVNSNSIGINKILLKGVYDSANFVITHYDSINVNVVSNDTLIGFYVSPKSQIFPSDHIFNLTYNAVYTNYVGVLNNVDSLEFTIADPNVVQYIDSLREFTTKDTGTTYIVYNYKGFVDTAFIYLSMPIIPDIVNLCPGSDALFVSDAVGSSYQWQVNTGNGFANISNNAIYSGATTDSLQLTNAPTSWYGYKYQCIALFSGDSTRSTLSILKFTDLWTGTSDSAWNNVANWSCGVMPDSNTDVIVNAGSPNSPNVNSNASCRSVNLNTGAMLKVKTGYKLNVTGKNE